MNYEINHLYHGFLLTRKYPVRELDATAHVFTHKKSGARLLYLQSTDDNKVFSVAFRTPPSDSTGVPHIIEHCVLSGSRKYATKEPFMDMVKGSLKTFINAMTFSDKTIYPVASRNEKDFQNLVDVYLDSVFFPKIHEDPEIFMQEGWHYDIHSEDDPITIKGVVYNEMRGAYSSPETILDDLVSQSLYPDTCYAHSSGGDPDVIPELTYEAFTAFHKAYYHPSNSYIFLYGDCDIDQHLKHIDTDYLSHFQAESIKSDIVLQEPLQSYSDISGEYPVSSDESLENKTYLSMNYDLGLTTNPVDYLSAQILKNVLVTSTAAPLKRALIEAGIGEDIRASVSDGVHMAFSIIAKNTNLSAQDNFKRIIDESIEKLVQEGIDQDLIESSINIVEYDLREASKFPTKGLIYHINSMQSWLYSDEPTTYLEYDKLIAALRDLKKQGHYETFLETGFLKNPARTMVALLPQKGLSEKKNAELIEKLSEMKKNLSEDQLKALIRQNQDLKETQLTPDSPEALATIPALNLEDVDRNAERIPQTVAQIGPATLLHHNLFTNDIAYVDLLFDAAVIEMENIPYINMLSQLITKMDTNRLTYGEMSNEIYTNTGGITLQPVVFLDKSDDNQFHPKLVVRGKAIGDKISKLMELIQELLTTTDLSSRQRLKEILQQNKARLESSIFQNGHSVTAKRVTSYHSPVTRYSELLSGLEYYWFISEILDSYDSTYEKVVHALADTCKKLFNSNGLVVSVTGSPSDLELAKDGLAHLLDALGQDKLEKAIMNLSAPVVNEGITSSAGVQYVAKGSNFKRLGFSYSGHLHVLSTILNGEYLHDRVRAKGGAYGCGISIGRTGNLAVSSYRDPNLTETLNVYDGMAEYVEVFSADQDTLTKFIIGAISRIDAAQTPHMKGRTATADYIAGVTHEDNQKEREEILATTPDDIRNCAPMLDAAMKENYLCVLGNDTTIKAQSDVFKTLVPLKK